MKFIFKSLLIIIIFSISLVYFSPKKNLYYLAEKESQKKNILISNEIVKESFLGLRIQGAEIYFDGLNIAFIKNIDFTSLLFFTNIEAKDLRVSNNFKNIVPTKIEYLKLNHSLLNFNKVKVIAKGDFGKFIGEILIFDKKIIGDLKPSNIMKSKYKNILRQFRLVEGEYKYEYKF